MSDTERSAISEPRQRALCWLQKKGISPLSLTPMSGYTNHVFLVTQPDPSYPQQSVLRLADFSLSAELCPLAHDFDKVVQKHIAVAELGLAPGVIMADQSAGAMWLQYAGQNVALKQNGFVEIYELLMRLHHSGLIWADGSQASLEVLLHGVLRKVQQEGGAFLTQAQQLSTLIEHGKQRGYFQYPLSPMHGDLNPGNLLHDGQRWWLIDWDFASMQVREWDFAGLIVEHDWEVTQAQQFVPGIALYDMKWFCSCFAFLSWHWHQQRGSDQRILAGKWQAMQYWITLKR